MTSLIEKAKKIQARKNGYNSKTEEEKEELQELAIAWLEMELKSIQVAAVLEIGSGNIFPSIAFALRDAYKNKKIRRA